MTCNVGGADRFARVVLGIAGIIVGFSLPWTSWRIVSFAVAAIALVTAAIAYCPVNRILHINTCEHEDPVHLPKYKP